jgi:signal transduction histidine kinase
LSKIHRQIADLLHDLPTAGAPQVQRFGLIGALQQAVEVEFTSAFDQVDWVVNPEISQELSRLPALQAEVLYFAAREAIRNAARHARADDNGVPLILCVSADLKNGLELTIQDNGIGIGDNGIGNESGGSGLTLHSTLMAVIGGALVVTSEPGKFTRVRLWLPTMKDQLSGF